MSYTWGLNSQAALVAFPAYSSVPSSAACNITYDKPAILHRYVSFDGATIALQQDFTYSTTWSSNPTVNGWASKQTTVTTHDLIRGTSFQTIYTYSGIGAPLPLFYNLKPFNDDAEMPQESTVVYQDTNGSVLKTVKKTWHDLYVIASEQTTLGSGGPTSQVVYTYGPGDQVTEKDEYDFGTFGSGVPGPLLRKTVTSYQPIPSTPIFTSSASILDRPSSVITYDGGNNKVAETDYTYDSYGTVGITSVTATGHDDGNYPASYPNRGNLTKKTQQCFVGSVACSNPTTTYTYDQTGQTLTLKDPNGNTTAYSYADSYTTGTPPGNTNAFLTQINYPSTSGVTHTVHYSYGYQDGRLTQSKDENSQITNYKYVDALDRPTETDFADGGKTTYAHYDAAPNPYVITSKKMNTSQNVVSVSTTDGIGHVTQTEITSVTPTISTETTYDGIGRVYTVSNPHSSTSNSTDGITTYTYDSLGRTTKVVEQDGSTVTTSYSGNSTTTTDEAQHQRTTTTDGLDRLKSVVEDPSGLNYLTTYTYDALGNPQTVIQNGSRNRSYVYDSLSRLTSSTTPESGLVKFVYDTNGNVLTKTDGRGIVTTFSPTNSPIDALNRVTSKTYSDGTPAVTFLYDAASANGVTIANPIGRLVRSLQASPCAGIFQSFDLMGRIVSQWQYDDYSCNGGHNGSAWRLDYTYDLLGNITSETDGEGITISYSYDGAARVSSVSSSESDAQHPATLATLSPSTGYWPNGEIHSMLFGNGLTESAVLDNRSQRCRINLNSGGTSLSHCSDSSPAGTILDLTAGYDAGTADNGNLYSLSATGKQSFNRSYTYDHLNRLSTMSAPGSACSGLSWTYDAWGNRLDQTSTGGSCNAPQLTVNSLNQVNSPGYAYDSSGNMTHDGTHVYTYDAENRVTQVDNGSGASYIYAPDGKRLEKKIGTSVTTYLYDLAGHVVAEDTGASWGPGYVYLNDRLFAYYSMDFVTVDQLGSTRLLTPYPYTAGVSNPDECDDYYPYGELIPCGGTGFTTHKFNGKERDTESNLDNFEARYMASGLGRFMSPDPSNAGAKAGDPQTWNAYSYVRNNPLSLTDPSGLLYCRPASQPLDGNVSMVCDVTDSQYFLDPKKYEAAGYVHYDCNCDSGIDRDAYNHPNGNASNDFIGDFLVAAVVYAGFEGIFGPSDSPQRQPQDENVNPDPPPSNNGNSTIGTNPNQKAALERDIAEARANGATDIRTNQQQVNAQGERVGTNRPDLQYTDKNGVRQYIEYEQSPAGRGAAHTQRIQANDPAGHVIIKYVK